MTQVSDLVSVLRTKAENDKKFHAVCQWWAVRHRARSEVRTASLVQRMHTEGFTDFEAADAAQILRFAASIGLGTLETDSKGRVKRLKDVRLSLQSIGRAAVGESAVLRSMRQRNRYTHVNNKGIVNPQSVVKPEAILDRPGLTIKVGAVEITVPDNYKEDRLMTLVKALKA